MRKGACSSALVAAHLVLRYFVGQSLPMSPDDEQAVDGKQMLCYLLVNVDHGEIVCGRECTCSARALQTNMNP